MSQEFFIVQDRSHYDDFRNIGDRLLWLTTSRRTADDLAGAIRVEFPELSKSVANCVHKVAVCAADERSLGERVAWRRRRTQAEEILAKAAQRSEATRIVTLSLELPCGAEDAQVYCFCHDMEKAIVEEAAAEAQKRRHSKAAAVAWLRAAFDRFRQTIDSDDVYGHSADKSDAHFSFVEAWSEARAWATYIQFPYDETSVSAIAECAIHIVPDEYWAMWRDAAAEINALYLVAQTMDRWEAEDARKLRETVEKQRAARTASIISAGAAMGVANQYAAVGTTSDPIAEAAFAPQGDGIDPKQEEAVIEILEPKGSATTEESEGPEVMHEADQQTSATLDFEHAQLLQAMLKKQAFDESSCRPGREITIEAFEQDTYDNGAKRYFRELKLTGLIQSRNAGPQGSGFWLTTEGRAVAERATGGATTGSEGA